MTTETDVRSLDARELRAAGRTLAASFDEDPLFRFLLPHARLRARWLELIMAASVFQAQRAGLALVPRGGPDGVITALGRGFAAPSGMRDLASRGPVGAAPAAEPPSPRAAPPGAPTAFLAWGFALDARRPPLPRPTLRLVRSGLRALRAIEAVHPPHPHFYVPVFGVHPSCKGRGLGRVLLGALCARADRAGVPVYLETSNPVNLGFYRHFGFEVRRELPTDGPPIWTMERAARRAEPRGETA